MLAFARALTFAWQNFTRNLWLSIVTVVILTLALTLVHFLTGVRVVADAALTAVRNRVDVVVFFQPDAAERDMTTLQTRLEQLPEVAQVTFVSKDDALATFRAQTLNDPLIAEALEALEANPLQASLVIKARQLEDYPAILRVVDDPGYADLVERDHVADAKLTFIERFTHWTRNLSRFGLALSAVFALIAALVVFNTIRITIHAYRTEIGIMKLVGASNAFIRAPFLIESVLYAVLASALALGLVWLAITASAPFLNRLLTGYNLDLAAHLLDNFVRVFGPPVLTAVALSMVSSAVAVGRYLRI